MKGSKAFFSSRVLLTALVGTVLVYLVCTEGYYHYLKFDQRHRREHAIAQQKAQYNSLSKEERAIRKTEALLEVSIATAGTSERIFFTYLQRKFDLPAALGTQGPPMDLHEDPKTYPEQIHFLARIAYPDRIVNLPPPKAELDDNGKITNIYSANCDHMALPNDFWTTMSQSIQLGDYYMTHVALALAMMKDNGCLLPPVAFDMKSQVEQDMVKLADSPTTVADLRYEAIAFLYLSGRSDLVKPRWIDQIVAEQHDDGTWGYKVGDHKADYHATLLALWALLEYSRPSTPYEPLIQHPVENN